MNVSEVSSTTISIDSSNKRKADILGKDEFLKLLVTQLKSQDPLNPMNDTDFIAQMAQFSSLEQMQNLNASHSFSQAIGLIGKSIVASKKNSSTGETTLINGAVDYVYSSGGTPYVKIGDNYVSLEDIQAIY